MSLCHVNSKLGWFTWAHVYLCYNDSYTANVHAILSKSVDKGNFESELPAILYYSLLFIYMYSTNIVCREQFIGIFYAWNIYFDYGIVNCLLVLYGTTNWINLNRFNWCIDNVVYRGTTAHLARKSWNQNFFIAISFNFPCNTLFYWLKNWGDFVSTEIKAYLWRKRIIKRHII
jgi:hypothetical protein